jgi:hypothetical protein
LADFIFQHGDIADVWHKISNYLIILSVPTEEDLHAVNKALCGLNISHTTFQEPDLGNELTAIAVEPSDEAAVFCRQFKVAFRKKDMLNTELIEKQYKDTKKKLNKYRR